MSFFKNWIYRHGSTKRCPKEIAESYVKIRTRNPTLNIRAIVTEIVRIHLNGWSLSPEQTNGILSLVKNFSYSHENPSDYHVLLHVSASLPYILTNKNKDNLPYENRKKIHDAACEGLQEGLGSFLTKARFLHTIKSDDGLIHHQLLSDIRKKESGGPLALRFAKAVHS